MKDENYLYTSFILTVVGFKLSNNCSVVVKQLLDCCLNALKKTWLQNNRPEKSLAYRFYSYIMGLGWECNFIYLGSCAPITQIQKVVANRAATNFGNNG